MIFSCSSSSSASFKNLLITFYLPKKVVSLVGYLRKTDGRAGRPRVPLLCIWFLTHIPILCWSHSSLWAQPSWLLGFGLGWSDLLKQQKWLEKKQHGAFCTQCQRQELGKRWWSKAMDGWNKGWQGVCLNCPRKWIIKGKCHLSAGEWSCSLHVLGEKGKMAQNYHF